MASTNDNADNADNATPLFSAVSGSARQLFQLLRCINFVSKTNIQITKEGLRFTVEESQVMQGISFLDKALFTAYTYSPPLHEDSEDFEPPPFQISLSSLLETLQIFGINDNKDRWSNRESNYNGINGFSSRGGPAGAFDNCVLGMNGICRLSYAAAGEPLCIILEETGVTTKCELVTYEPEFQEEIPLQKDAIAQKIIMRASWLHDAINELSSTSPTRLTIVSSPTAPYFTLSSTGPLGSATVEFSKDPQLLETFQVPNRTVNTYKYSLIKGASRAMAIANKVSIRSDEQGVLSLQFMVEVEGGGFSFVDFRFVPFIPEEGEGDEDNEVGEADGFNTNPFKQCAEARLKRRKRSLFYTAYNDLIAAGVEQFLDLEYLRDISGNYPNPENSPVETTESVAASQSAEGGSGNSDVQSWNLSDFIIKTHGEEYGPDLVGDDEIDKEGFEIIKDECDREGKEAVVIITRRKVLARDTQFWTS